MKRAKKMLAFVLAAAMLMSNIAYAAPEGGTDTGVAVDTLSLDPTEEAGGETPTEEVPEETVPDETPEEQVSEETETTAEKRKQPAEKLKRRILRMERR